MWAKDIMKEIHRLERRIENLELNHGKTLEGVLGDLLDARDTMKYGKKRGLANWLPDDRVKDIIHKLASSLIKEWYK